MTNQIQGELLFKGWSGTLAADWVYTPWMRVAGDVATFGVEVIARNGVTLTWDVETRTLESAAAVSVFGTPPATVSTTGVHLDTNDDITDPDTLAKELVRYKFHTGSTASTTDYVVFRALMPSWQKDR